MLKSLPQLHLDNQLCFSVYSLSRLITQAYQPLLTELNLTYPQYLVMLVLWQEAERDALPVTVKYLCQRLLLDTGTLTPLLQRVERAGFIQRERSTEDERVVLISLTKDGVLLRDRAARIPVQILCDSQVDLMEAQTLRERVWRMISRWRDRNNAQPTESVRPVSDPE